MNPIYAEVVGYEEFRPITLEGGDLVPGKIAFKLTFKLGDQLVESPVNEALFDYVVELVKAHPATAPKQG